MILQPILFPREDICKETDLYYRSDSKQFGCNFLLSPYQTISFDTYFNSFSIESWKEYTSITNLSLYLKINGKCSIELFEATLANGRVQNRLLSTHEKKEIDESITIPFPNIANIHGICFFKISSKEESCRIINGFYGTEINSSSINSIKIGIGICTYKREAFILKNLKAIQNTILDNQQSELYNNLEIIISDNGQTLHNFNYSHPNVQIFPNINAGGAGGFAKCMIEAISQNSNLNLTHFILMDDDIILDPAILVRTYYFLRCLKGESRAKLLGGAMLKLENMSEQAINGCVWNTLDGDHYCNPNYNLSNISNILKNLENNDANFAPWFYCCIPMQHIRKDNLPLPFFFQFDDTEFCLREQSSVILLNGISVWHSFLNKDNMCKQYCSHKNRKIIMLLKSSSEKILSTKKELFISFIYLVGSYRYLEWIAQSQAELDLWQGSKKLMSSHTISFCQKIIKKNYAQCSIKDITSSKIQIFKYKPINFKCTLTKKISYLTSVFNTFMPKFKTNLVISNSCDLAPVFFRFRKAVFIQQDKNAYTIFRSDFKLFFLSIVQFVKILIQKKPTKSELQNDFHEKLSFMTSIDFWKHYLT